MVKTVDSAQEKFTQRIKYYKEIRCYLMLFDVIYLDLKEFFIDKKLFIPAQYSDESGMCSINGSNNIIKLNN